MKSGGRSNRLFSSRRGTRRPPRKSTDAAVVKSSDGANQRASSEASVHAQNTLSRGAENVRLTTSVMDGEVCEPPSISLTASPSAKVVQASLTGVAIRFTHLWSNSAHPQERLSRLRSRTSVRSGAMDPEGVSNQAVSRHRVIADNDDAPSASGAFVMCGIEEQQV
jgi:hypothetical protein